MIAPLGAIPTDKKSGILSSVRLFTYENQGFADASCFSAIIVNGFCFIFPLLKFHLFMLSVFYPVYDIDLISFLII